MSKLLKHLKTIKTHRKWVRKWCFKMGIPLRGLLHDLSKYSIKELSIAKYYTGTRSPHDNMRDNIGYSTSWYHHRNRNKHHWEYWIDSYNLKTAVKMPYKYVIEMLCDMCGAGQAYNNEKWQPKEVAKYYNKRYKSDAPEPQIINPQTQYLFEKLIYKLAELNNMKQFIKWYKKNKKTLKKDYKEGKMYD